MVLLAAPLAVVPAFLTVITMTPRGATSMTTMDVMDRAATVMAARSMIASISARAAAARTVTVMTITAHPHPH
jgi:hypothetical protein